MLLEIEEIKVSYGGVQALLGVSMDVQEGEIICILGGNGAGKSTLVNTICGFVSPISGKILFKGENIKGLTPHLIVRLGIVQVPEGRGIFGTLSVLDNLKIGAYLGRSKEEVKKAFDHIYDLFPILKERRKQSGGAADVGHRKGFNGQSSVVADG